MTWGEFKAEVEGGGWDDDTPIVLEGMYAWDLNTPEISWTTAINDNGELEEWGAEFSDGEMRRMEPNHDNKDNAYPVIVIR